MSTFDLPMQHHDSNSENQIQMDAPIDFTSNKSMPSPDGGNEEQNMNELFKQRYIEDDINLSDIDED